MVACSAGVDARLGGPTPPSPRRRRPRRRPVSRRASAGIGFQLLGTIAGAGFSSGHRFVVGHCDDSPLGPIDDVMRARPDGRRVLLVHRRGGGAHHRGVPLRHGGGRAPHVPDGRCRACGGRRRRVDHPAGRPAVAHPPAPAADPAGGRPVERLVARGLLGVRTWGLSSTRVREWYRADEYRRVVAGEASLAGRPGSAAALPPARGLRLQRAAPPALGRAGPTPAPRPHRTPGRGDGARPRPGGGRCGHHGGGPPEGASG